MKRFQVRFHGTGNAWPVPLGREHPFYDRKNAVELSNAAYSLLTDTANGSQHEVVVDAGHGTVQSLLSTTNRIPDMVCLTHGHLDHTLSLDWIVQSYCRQSGKGSRYPVYCTRPVYDIICTNYPHLEELIAFLELSYGEPHPLENTSWQVTAFPVYHGPWAKGACMLLFYEQGTGARILFTGDLLTPLVRLQDLHLLEGLDLVICDANNRFPYPRSNHWSIKDIPEGSTAGYLVDFRSDLTMEKLLQPHQPSVFQPVNQQYLDQLAFEKVAGDQVFVLEEFLKLISPRQAAIVHYSGSEDEKYYNRPLLSRAELSAWLKMNCGSKLTRTHLFVPVAGDVITLDL